MKWFHRKSFTKKHPLLILGLAAGVALVAAAVVSNVFRQSTTLSKHSHQRQVSVSVSPVQQRDVTVTTTVVGSVEPHITVAIKSLVDGQITAVAFKEGDFVKRGQVLFEIDPKPFIVKLQQAQANLAHDQSQYHATYLLVKRNRPLAEKGYIAKQDYDQLKANLGALTATLKAEEAAVAAAKLELSYCTIKSPIDARSGSLQVNVGTLVKANDQTPMVVLNQIMPIDVKFSIPEKQLALLTQSMQKQPLVKVRANLDQNDNVIKDGVLSFIDNTVDTETGMIMLKASFPNKDQYFWPGQFAKIVLPLTVLPQAVLVPTRAVQMGQDGAYVFIVDAANKARIQSISLGPTIGDETVVNKGVVLGQMVVTEGQTYLSGGTPVTIARHTK